MNCILFKNARLQGTKAPPPPLEALFSQLSLFFF